MPGFFFGEEGEGRGFERMSAAGHFAAKSRLRSCHGCGAQH